MNIGSRILASSYLWLHKTCKTIKVLISIMTKIWTLKYQVFDWTLENLKSFSNFLFSSYKSESLQKSCLQMAMNILKRKTKPRQFPQIFSSFRTVIVRIEKRIKKLNLNFLQPFVLLCVRNTIHSEASVINYLILLYLRVK